MKITLEDIDDLIYRKESMKKLFLRYLNVIRGNYVVRIMAAPIIILKKRIELFLYQFSKDSKYIAQFKNKHAGQRCFIIGNGPSLTAEDLEKLKNEITFGCNRIYNIFGKTNWRPQYYMCADAECIADEIGNIKKLKGPTKFISKIAKKYKISDSDEIHFFILKMPYLLKREKFMKKDISLEVARYFSGSYTVTCMEIEFAIYMGFKEIYLLGVDHNYPITIGKDGKIQKDNSVKSHFNGGGSKESSLHYIYLDSATQCYQVYRDYADVNNINIYNATRGGKLEVFERRDLDKVLGLAQEEVV